MIKGKVLTVGTGFLAIGMIGLGCWMLNPAIALIVTGVLLLGDAVVSYYKG